MKSFLLATMACFLGLEPAIAEPLECTPSQASKCGRKNLEKEIELLTGSGARQDCFEIQLSAPSYKDGEAAAARECGARIKRMFDRLEGNTDTTTPEQLQGKYCTSCTPGSSGCSYSYLGPFTDRTGNVGPNGSAEVRHMPNQFEGPSVDDKGNPTYYLTYKCCTLRSDLKWAIRYACTRCSVLRNRQLVSCPPPG